MSLRVRADLFWVIPDENAGSMPAVIKAFVKGHKDGKFLEAHFGGNCYRLDHVKWDAGGVFTGTIYRCRSNNLPSTMVATGAAPLPIDADADLGEPMCFAYAPVLGAAAIQYAHTGARHPRLANFLNEIGFGHAIHVSPILSDKAEQMLRNANIVRKLEFTLQSPQVTKELRAVDKSVNGALDVLSHAGGVNIGVTVTMGHESGSLAARVKDTVRAMTELGDTVTTLRLRGAEDDESALQVIDFINDRISQEIEVNEAGRELDKKDCCRKLVQVLDAHTSEIRRQLRG